MINSCLKVQKVLYVFNSEEEILFLYLIHPGNKVFWHLLTQTAFLLLLSNLRLVVDVVNRCSVRLRKYWG